MLQGAEGLFGNLSPELQAEIVALEASGPHRASDDAPKRVPGPGAVRGRFYRPVKHAVSIRLDADILAHFSSDGPGYQTRINDALRQVMEEERASVQSRPPIRRQDAGSTRRAASPRPGCPGCLPRVRGG